MEPLWIKDCEETMQARLIRPEAGVPGAPEVIPAQGSDETAGLADGFFTGVCYDNREVQQGDLFFAFPGERHDGHDFVEDALQKGASGCVISREPKRIFEDRSYLLVKDTVSAYGALAAACRARLDIPVVGVTGSVGKTTTKDLIAAVLSQRFRTVSTKGNLNNHIGLPRTVFGMETQTEAAVLEMGMNHPGEISYLTKIAQPTIAVITNIGDAHIGILGSREAILKAKSEIFEGLSADGLIVLNADDELLMRIPADEAICGGRELITVGENEAAFLRAMDITETADGVQCTLIIRKEALFAQDAAGKKKQPLQLTIPFPGRHMIYPALTAYAIGRYLGLTHEEAAAGIAGAQKTGMRMEILTRPGNVTILNDTYNANPQSMKAALHTLAQRQNVRRVAVLGDMFELGDDTERLHREVGEEAATCADVLIAVGEAARWIADEATKHGMADVQRCADKAAAKEVLAPYIRQDCAVLFKASRGMRMEELIADVFGNE